MSGNFGIGLNNPNVYGGGYYTAPEEALKQRIALNQQSFGSQMQAPLQEDTFVAAQPQYEPQERKSGISLGKVLGITALAIGALACIKYRGNIAKFIKGSGVDKATADTTKKTSESAKEFVSSLVSGGKKKELDALKKIRNEKFSALSESFKANGLELTDAELRKLYSIEGNNGSGVYNELRNVLSERTEGKEKALAAFEKIFGSSYNDVKCPAGTAWLDATAKYNTQVNPFRKLRIAYDDNILKAKEIRNKTYEGIELNLGSDRKGKLSELLKQDEAARDKIFSLINEGKETEAEKAINELFNSKGKVAFGEHGVTGDIMSKSGNGGILTSWKNISQNAKSANTSVLKTNYQALLDSNEKIYNDFYNALKPEKQQIFDKAIEEGDTIQQALVKVRNSLSGNTSELNSIRVPFNKMNEYYSTSGSDSLINRLANLLGVDLNKIKLS